MTNVELHKKLSANLQFISLFIALYENFEDYVLECPKQLFEGGPHIRDDQTDKIKEVQDKHKKEKELSLEYLKSSDYETLNEEIRDNVEVVANYDYTKITRNGFVRWLSPEYDKLILKREISINGKLVKKPLYNSIMFLVDNGAIQETDFHEFIKLRELRNELTHKMGHYIISGIEDWQREKFSNLVKLYVKVNNFWSVEFELSISGDDIPQGIEIDYSNAIDTELYNLLVAIDVLQGTEFAMTKKWLQPLIGLYTCIMLPVEENENGN